MPELVWTSRAEDSLTRIYARLEDLNEGRGDVFLEAVNGTVSFLEVFPHLGNIQFENVRRLLIRGTDFGIFYTVENRGVIVHRVADLRQDPDWIRREVTGER